VIYNKIKQKLRSCGFVNITKLIFKNKYLMKGYTPLLWLFDLIT